MNNIPPIQPEDPADNKGLPNDYRKTNKLDYILDSSTKALLAAKYAFSDQLRKYIAVEKEFCRRTGTPAQMQGEKYNQVCSMLERCEDFYAVEALAQFVFDDCIIPTSTELAAKASKIKTLSGMWIPGRTRSY